MNIKKILLISFLVGFILVSHFSLLVSAQVNINSKKDPSDSQWYELSDTEVIVKPGPTTIVELPQTGGDTSVLSSSTTKTIQDVQKTIVEDPSVAPIIKTVVATIGLPGVTSAGFSLAFLPAILPLIPLLLSPQLLFLILGALFGDQKNVWGIVYDLETKKPVAFAVVRLFESDSTSLITEKVSDLEGRYGFVLSKGSYRLEVSQTGYTTYKKEIKIEDKEQLFAEDIGLQRYKNTSPLLILKNIFFSIRKFILKYSIIFAGIGLLFAIFALLFERSVFNIGIFIFYALIILLYFYIRYKHRRDWGVVVDSETKLRISGATIRLFDPKNSLADTQLSDSRGRFGFIIDPGNYSLLVKASGYTYPSKSQQDLSRNSQNADLLDIEVTKSKFLNLQIMMDPAGTFSGTLSQPAAVPSTDKLQSPFGT